MSIDTITDDTYQKYQKLKEVICYLEQHYSEAIHIEQLAATFGYSKNHFMSIFKQHTGASCMDYLLQLRLEKSCEKLVQTNLQYSRNCKPGRFHQPFKLQPSI